MKIAVVCKASTQIGLGHLIRTYSFICQALKSRNDIQFDYYVIGDASLKKLIINPAIKAHFVHSEVDLVLKPSFDFLILDMTDVSNKNVNEWKKRANQVIVFSPIFNQFQYVDYYFGRTKYLQFEKKDFPKLKIYAGLEFAIIQENCKFISAGIFEENLNSDHLPIAIAMGGGDAKNKTLEVLKALKKCKVPATFWVMVGEGYKHSVEDLVTEIRKDTNHEIILAKTNSSMWRILHNCVLCILPGGITSYEAVYAGLPSINFFEQDSQRFLLNEILEFGAAWDFGIYSQDTLERIVEFVEDLSRNRKKLLQMHVNSKSLIDNNGVNRILEIITK